MQKLKELIKLRNLCNFQLFASNIEGNISHQKLRNCCVAKKLMSHTFSVKFRVFKREFLRNHSVYWAQIFRDNWNCYALSIFRVFILLASSDSDKHMLMRQKVQTNFRLWGQNNRNRMLLTVLHPPSVRYKHITREINGLSRPIISTL